jgi:hypothetical protein
MNFFDPRTLQEMTLGRLTGRPRIDSPRIRSSQDILLEAGRMERDIRNHQRLPW